jgi:quinol-cytochrome oxidoreductase complex cytochrome b subunit
MSAGISDDNRKRLGRINRNFFLHIHANKVHPHSLKTSYTFGLGVILGFLFMVMILTGVILMMNYTPSIERAYNSVKDIVFVVPGGRYIRNMHRWAAHGMVLVSFLHLIRVFLTGGYLAGRRLNWIIGVCILVVVLFMRGAFLEDP